MSDGITAYLALGSNVGDRLANLRQAVTLLRDTRGLAVDAVSRVYETEPVGVRDQPWFLNAVVRVTTTLTPRQLLRVAKDIEAKVGRTATYRWGPREIDVDVLLHGEEVVNEPDLTIPHPRMAERLFVLLPLRDLAPGWRDASGVSIDDLVERLRGTEEVRPNAAQI